MGWNVRISSAFQPAGAASFPPPERLLLPDTRLYGVSSPLAWLFRLYPLNFFTRFIHRTVFCRRDNDVFILHTTRHPVPLHCPAPFSYPASPGERPRAQPVVAAGFKPACRYYSGGARNTDPGGT